MHTEELSGSPNMLRQLNRARVLRAVRERGPLTRSELADVTRQSRPTVNDVLAELLDAGYLVERRSDGTDRPRRPGPRARMVAFRSDVGHVLGIDIGATKALVLVADLGGQVLARARMDTSGLRDRRAVLELVRACAAAALAEAGVTPATVRSVGVGTPGVVDPVTGTVSLAPQLPGWEGLPLADQLALPVPCRVLVDNEVRLAVLGEQWTGAAQGVDDAVYVHLGVGIGLGILVGGRIYRGSAGAAGEIGYLPVTDTDGGQPGATGALEHAAGASAFARLGRQAAARAGGQLLRELAGGRPEAVDALVVFDAARQGDRAATAVVDTLVRRLARGVAAVCLVLNPSTVIVGGGLSRAGSSLLEPLERHTAALVPFASRWVLSALGDEAVAYGAVRLALQTVDEQLYAVPAGASA